MFIFKERHDKRGLMQERTLIVADLFISKCDTFSNPLFYIYNTDIFLLLLSYY